MLLVEADGKALLRAAGIAVPAGVVVSSGEVASLPGAGPWMVKAQVPAGGRGKAGGVARCGDAAEVGAALARQFGLRLKGHAVRACLVEAAAVGEERYLALMLDPARHGVRVLHAVAGGVDVEAGGADSLVVAPEEMQAITGTRLETVRMVDREEVGQEKDQEERLEQESQVKDFRVRQVLTRSEMVEAAPELPPLERMVVSVQK